MKIGVFCGRRKPFAGVLISALCCALSGAVSAEPITGTVTYVGTLGEVGDTSGFVHARFRFRLSESVCGSDQARKDRWIHVRSGRMDGNFQHNSANFRNAYNTVMSGLLARTVVYIALDVPSCDANSVQEINLPNAAIGLAPK